MQLGPRSRNAHGTAAGTTRRLWLPLAVVTLMTSILAATPRSAAAQTADEREVVAVVEKFFKGMEQRDTTMMRSTIDASARLVGASVREGVTTIRTTAMDQFIASVGRQADGPAAIERIYAPEVRIDGSLAQVWTFYTLHIGERFSHCGYDAFHLLRTEQGWKIVNVADTRRTERCDAPG